MRCPIVSQQQLSAQAPSLTEESQQAQKLQEQGAHGAALALYRRLVAAAPNHPVLRRNLLTSLQYAPQVGDAERLAAALEWGQWAVQRAGGPFSRPPVISRLGQPLRVGYVGADFCQHTVGMFVKDVIQNHRYDHVHAFVYSAGTVHDWVTDHIKTNCRFHDVARLDDDALAQLIRSHQIDVLVDLSGHTAGSRLTAFAYRPAPVQLSWLGYFATTGLDCIDGVLLDEWHAPPQMQEQFVEPILRLPQTRWCFTQPPFAPEVRPAPCLQNGYVTFGSFNNTAKLNEAVLDLWADVLLAVPDSRLILKWRTFSDEASRAKVLGAFNAKGVDASRIELRGQSVHADMLAQYADIDIALDPFPFTGGMTSCEALWMGVPVITWPQSRVVSRQTYSVLQVMGLTQCVAQDGAQYAQLAQKLAARPLELEQLRQSMRQRMKASPLMDVPRFTAALEAMYRQVHEQVSQEPAQPERTLGSAPSESISKPDLKESTMPTITIDNREFDVDKLSPEARQQLEMLMACENKLRELQRDTMITQTARNAYAAALKSLLPTALEETLAMGDTLKLGV